MGARLVQNNLDKIVQLYTRRAISICDEAMDVAEQVADSLVPVRRGWLKASKRRIGKGTKHQLIRYGTLKRVPYALFVEIGTRKSAAKPFLRPGGEAARRRLIARGMRVRSYQVFGKVR